MSKRLLISFLASLVFGCMAFGASFTGIVSDDHCKAAAKHLTPGDEAAACVKKCVDGGAKYTLVVGKTVYNVDPQDKFAEFAGQKVKVTGTKKGDTITATAVAAAPAAAKKGGGKKKAAKKA